jgi:hypothetical protein
MTFPRSQILFGERDRRSRWHAWQIREMNVGFWYESLKARDRLEDVELDNMLILKFIIQNCNGKTWTGMM